MNIFIHFISYLIHRIALDVINNRCVYIYHTVPRDHGGIQPRIGIAVHLSLYSPHLLRISAFICTFWIFFIIQRDVCLITSYSSIWYQTCVGISYKFHHQSISLLFRLQHGLREDKSRLICQHMCAYLIPPSMSKANIA